MNQFVDEVRLRVVAGRGGKGAVSFRREKYVPAGGPDGGDGGRGGDVVVISSSTDVSLSAYAAPVRYLAEPGGNGAGGLKAGRRGTDLQLAVPPGTVVHDADTGELIGDLDRSGAAVVVAAGGRGGRGNARFATSTRRAPRVGELGAPGETRHIRLELKLIADIGLVGLPNAGKSALLAALTGAHPKIGNYPFTTLQPNLGVAEVDGRPITIADVPGLIAGAHDGAGLGIAFLRHIERTRVLVHVVDASVDPEEARVAIEQIEEELRAFNSSLAGKPSLLAFNKMDVPSAADTSAALLEAHPGAHRISALTGEGCRELIEAAAALVWEARSQSAVAWSSGSRAEVDEARPRRRVYRHQPAATRAPVVVRKGGAFRVLGADLEEMVAMTDLDNDEAVQRLQRQLRRRGVEAALVAAGCVEGDTVRIGGMEFTYSDDHAHSR